MRARRERGKKKRKGVAQPHNPQACNLVNLPCRLQLQAILLVAAAFAHVIPPRPCAHGYRTIPCAGAARRCQTHRSVSAMVSVSIATCCCKLCSSRWLSEFGEFSSQKFLGEKF